MNKVKDSSKVCDVSAKCGGCQYSGMDYELQLQEKQKKINNLFNGIIEPDKIIGMNNPFYYRNKVTATFARRKQEIISGIYEAGTHRVIPVKNCIIEDERARDIITTVTELAKSFKFTVYNEDSGYGLLRHIMVRTAHTTGQIMVVLVTGSPVFPSRNNFRKALLAKHPEITTIVQNINDKNTSMVLGNRNQTIYGRGYIVDELCNKKFRISPNSFYQVNSIQTEVLYNRAIKYADLKNKETIVDAYCGIGTIGIAASDRAKEVIGVELNPDAVRDARTNVAMNKIENVTFYNNDAGKFMVDMAAEGKKADVVFMDPPRSGSTPEFMSSVIKLKPKKVIYISCEPETLARDLKYFIKHGYQPLKLTPVDMFPFTTGLESIVLLRWDGL